MTIELRVNEYLKAKGIKQSFVCEKTGMSADAVSRICNGTRKMSATEFISVCEALNVDPRQFANPTDDKSA